MPTNEQCDLVNFFFQLNLVNLFEAWLFVYDEHVDFTRVGVGLGNMIPNGGCFVCNRLIMSNINSLGVPCFDLMQGRILVDIIGCSFVPSLVITFYFA